MVGKTWGGERDFENKALTLYDVKFCPILLDLIHQVLRISTGLDVLGFVGHSLTLYDISYFHQ